MSYQTWIADACRDFGLAVEEYGGWTDRGSSSFDPQAALAHWTAGPCHATGRPSLSTVVNGRSDLDGPLANVYLDRQGVCVIVAAGRANHAGEGGYRGLSGNSSVLGVEAEACNAGDWTEAQLQTYPVLMAALVAGIGRDASWVARHCDWTSRKIDTSDLSLEWFQAGAAEALAGGGDLALSDADKAWIRDTILDIVRKESISGATDSGVSAVDEAVIQVLGPKLDAIAEAVGADVVASEAPDR